MKALHHQGVIGTESFTTETVCEGTEQISVPQSFGVQRWLERKAVSFLVDCTYSVWGEGLRGNMQGCFVHRFHSW